VFLPVVLWKRKRGFREGIGIVISFSNVSSSRGLFSSSVFIGSYCTEELAVVLVRNRMCWSSVYFLSASRLLQDKSKALS
jgi:hypothetical protein